LLLAATGSWLLACNPALTPIEVGADCPDMPIRGPEQWADATPEAVIDDFEDGDEWVNAVAGRTGNWYSFPAGSTTAAGGAGTKCAARGERSGHFVVTSSNNPTNWNVSMYFPFTAVIPYDASAWGGFSFWIATGNPADDGTTMTVGINTPGVVLGGACMTCGDYHNTAVTLTRNWTRWSIRFADLKQEGWGVPQIPQLPKDQIVNFIFWPANPFDFWIDDFRFEP
jgi:hypothetical protein